MVDHATIDHSAVTGVAFVGARAYAGATTNCTDSTWTSIALNSERFDTNAFHDNATNNSRLTVPSGKSGKYLIGACGQFAPNATGIRAFRIFLNNTTRIGETLMANTGAATGTRATIVTLYDLVATDYVELQQFQNSTGTLASENSANSSCELWMYRVG